LIISSHFEVVAKKLDTNEADSYNEALVDEVLFTEDIAKIESLKNLTNCLVIIGDRVYILFLKKKKKQIWVFL
jgi:plastocyanin domain-containing protein